MSSRIGGKPGSKAEPTGAAKDHYDKMWSQDHTNCKGKIPGGVCECNCKHCRS